MKKQSIFKRNQIKFNPFILAILWLAPTIVQSQTYQWDYPTSSAASGLSTGGCTTDDISKGITLDGAGNSYVVGTFQGTASFLGLTPLTLTTTGGNDVFIAKKNPSGANLWVAQGKGLYDDRAMSVAVYPDGTGGVNTYVTGCFKKQITFTSYISTATAVINSASGSTTHWDMYIVKYNNSGIVQWAMDCGNSTGGNHTIGWDIAVNNSQNNGSQISIWIAGSYMGTTSFGASPYNAVTNQSGNATNQNGFLANYTDGATAPTGVAWVATMKTLDISQTLGVAADFNGNSYVTGYYTTSTVTVAGTTGSTASTQIAGGADDGFLARFDWQGGLTHADKFGSGASTATSGVVGAGIAVDGSGAIYISGTFVGTAALPGVFLGWATTYTSFGSTDAFLMRLNNSCTTVQWLTQIGSTGADHGARIAVDNCGQRCYMVGDFTGTCDFGNSVTLTSYGGSDSYLTDFTAGSGLAIAATRQGTIYTDAGYDVAVNSVEDIQFCGAFGYSTTSGTSTMTFDPNGSSFGHVGLTSVYDGFVARWDHSDWPTLETTSVAINQGVSSVNCSDYAVGDLSGTATFGAYSQTPSNNDIYLVACDKYAIYNSFLLLTNGTSEEKCKDVVSDATYHYVSGSAATSTNKTAVTFVNDPGGTDNFTNTNATSNAIVIKSTLAGAVQWGTSIRPNTASSSATGIGVAYDGSGNVYFCGYYNGATSTVAVYNQGGTTTGNAGYLLASAGSNDIFVIKYNSSGAVQWKKTFGGTGDDRALGISIDPSSSYYYITGSCGAITFGSLTAHTLVGTTDGYVMRGDLSNANVGAPISQAFFTTASVADQGNDIYANSMSEVYVTGVKSVATNVYIGSFDLTNATGTNNWNTASSGGTGIGNDILLGGNGYVYVSGMITAATLSFGSFSFASLGAYVVGVTSWGGTPTWGSAVYTAPECNGLCQDDEVLSTDHGFINLICGNKTSGGKKAYIHKASQEGLEFSSRYANPEAEQNLTQYGDNITTVYPNPFNDNTTIRFKSEIDPSTIPVSLTLLDVTGRIIKRIDGINSQEIMISAENLTNGMYFYQVVQNGNIIDSGKMIVRK